MAADFERFKAKILKLTGFDLASYKEKQILRRISALMQQLGVKDFDQYYRILEQDARQRENFLRRVTINVSEFFRNPERFEELARVHLPAILKRNQKPRLWSAGTSTGEEAYTLAILLLELNPAFAGTVLATDIDQEALQYAAAGVYPPGRLRNVPPAYLKKYFEPAGENYRVKEQVKALVRLRRHDLLRDPFGTGFDLILCRNVVIYLTEEAKEKLYRKFFHALKPGGILFTGTTEQIFNSRELGFINVSPFFYQKAPSGG